MPVRHTPMEKTNTEGRTAGYRSCIQSTSSGGEDDREEIVIIRSAKSGARGDRVLSARVAYDR